MSNGAPRTSTARAAGSVGLLLDGRYRLEDRTGRDGPSTTWNAHDEQLDRPVVLRVVAGDTAEATVDAARRAAALEDLRLARVLDVGVDAPGLRTGSGAAGSGGEHTAPLAWTVTERPAGRTLVELLREGPLPASRARTVVGEAARALQRASAAGLHHRRLDPSSIVVGDDGSVLVLGLEVAAAAAGLPGTTPEQADREDAVGLVSLLYAALTGLWPHGSSSTRSAHLAGAPAQDGAPSPPGELVPGVPNDLDTLATVTFGPYDDGPHSPGELADQLAPWRWGTDALPAGPAAAPAAELAGTSPGLRTRRRSTETTRTTPRHAAPLAPPAAAAARPASAARHGDDDLTALVGDVASAPDPQDDLEPARPAVGRWVLAGAGALLVGALALAAANLPQIGGVLGIAPSQGGTPAVPSAAAPSAAAPSDPAAAPTPAPAAEPLAVAGARALDPLGDGEENGADAALVLDGDPATAWSSETYESAALGGLKPGVGLALDLGQGSTVTAVELVVAGTGGVVEVRSSPDGSFESSTVLATAEVGSGSAEPVVVQLPQPAQTPSVVLWFTTLPQVGGEFRVEVGTAAVRGAGTPPS